jgi:hypothetical protein
MGKHRSIFAISVSHVRMGMLREPGQLDLPMLPT